MGQKCACPVIAPRPRCSCRRPHLPASRRQNKAPGGVAALGPKLAARPISIYCGRRSGALRCSRRCDRGTPSGSGWLRAQGSSAKTPRRDMPSNATPLCPRLRSRWAGTARGSHGTTPSLMKFSFIVFVASLLFLSHKVRVKLVTVSCVTSFQPSGSALKGITVGPTMTPRQDRGPVFTRSTRSAPGRQRLPRERQAALMCEQPGSLGQPACSGGTVAATGGLSMSEGEVRSC